MFIPNVKDQLEDLSFTIDTIYLQHLRGFYEETRIALFEIMNIRYDNNVDFIENVWIQNLLD